MTTTTICTSCGLSPDVGDNTGQFLHPLHRDRRIVEVCSCCGDDDICTGAEVVTVEVWSPWIALGVDRAPVLGTREDGERVKREGRAA